MTVAIAALITFAGCSSDKSSVVELPSEASVMENTPETTEMMEDEEPNITGDSDYVPELEIDDRRPSEDYAYADKIYSVFEEMSNYDIQAVKKESNITTYSYISTPENADKDVFREFVDSLPNNGYLMSYEIVDGAGFRNGYELDYGRYRLTVMTECTPESVVLTVTDHSASEQ